MKRFVWVLSPKLLLKLENTVSLHKLRWDDVEVFALDKRSAKDTDEFDR